MNICHCGQCEKTTAPNCCAVYFTNDMPAIDKPAYQLSRLSEALFRDFGLIEDKGDYLIISFRYYQAQAIDAFIQFTCQKPYTNVPAVLWLGCGAGKSIIIAAIVHWITMKAPDKKCIATAPGIGLAKNNRRKYLETGNPAGFFCGSENIYNLNHPVTYGVIDSFSNHLQQVLRYDIALVIPDEAHAKRTQWMPVRDAILEQNTNCKTCEVTATPFTDKGWIFNNHYQWGSVDQCEPTADAVCIYQKTEADLIAEGYLTGYEVMPFNLEEYL